MESNGGEWESGEAANRPKNVKNITIKVVREKGKRATSSSSSSSSSHSYCQADECGMDLNMAKSYNRRHKVCERHAKAPVVLVSSIRQRFCQQCSKFHEVAKFDENKRSCRLTLAGHNERRRKTRIDLSLRKDDISINHTHISSDQSVS